MISREQESAAERRHLFSNSILREVGRAVADLKAVAGSHYPGDGCTDDEYKAAAVVACNAIQKPFPTPGPTFVNGPQGVTLRPYQDRSLRRFVEVTLHVQSGDVSLLQFEPGRISHAGGASGRPAEGWPRGEIDSENRCIVFVLEERPAKILTAAVEHIRNQINAAAERIARDVRFAWQPFGVVIELYRERARSAAEQAAEEKAARFRMRGTPYAVV